ncbi:MAG: hypothetical protein U1F98_11740 [Verrucomicrobiota bacterium]
MNPDPASITRRLDSFDPAERRAALLSLLHGPPGRDLPAPGSAVNLHAHTFFSYNAHGWSPSHFAWRARTAGLAAAGIVDFDVLDGVDEFLDAGRLIGLKTCASLESRVFVPEFASLVLNSPGEPGIAYHMGAGFPRAVQHPFLSAMRDAATRRTRDLLSRVNRFLSPVEVDFDRDVAPLTPAGNVTERHVCAALERKAEQVFPDPQRRAEFWRDKIGDAPAAGPELQNRIRARTMKSGGAGYVKPDQGSFPRLADMNRFVLEAGAIPTLTWLDGTSEGEQQIEEWFDVSIAAGAAALNIIPDRNYTPGVRDRKLANLQAVIQLAEQRDFPVIVGTEMNAPGNKFVDSFETAELAPLLPVFLKGAQILHAHTLLQSAAGLGLLSPWAKRHFPAARDRNRFFEQVGHHCAPGNEALSRLTPDSTPDHILTATQ